MILSVIGFGEVGQCYAESFRAIGYEVHAVDPNPSSSSRTLAERIGIVIASKITEDLATSVAVIAAVPGPEAAEVFNRAACFLAGGSLYLDLSTAAPEVKQHCMTAGLPAAIDYIDGAIMGAIALSGVKTPLLLAGAGADRAFQLLSEVGAPCRVIPDGVPGNAVAIKFLRSVFTKSLEALTVECMMIAEKQGVREEWLSSLEDIDRTGIQKFLPMLVKTHLLHARRRMDEVIEAERQFSREGIELGVLSATKKRFQSTVEAIQKSPHGLPNPSTTDALAWLMANETRKP